MECTLERAFVAQFEGNLRKEEKSKATIEKYVRDVNAFLDYVGEGNCITKEVVISFKQQLAEKYAVSSANSMLAAANAFLRFLGCHDCMVKAFRVQKAVFRPREQELTREEYFRLVEAARRRGDTRLSLIMQTICATGIRISELSFITVEALRVRRAVVSLKGKSRVVIMPSELCRELQAYARERDINTGSLFVTNSGKAVDRSNILHAMKALCGEAGVDRAKVFPHNLRHLFAVTYYNVEKDVCHLADLLGHSSVNTTRIYTLVSCDTLEEQIEKMGLVL